MTHQIECDWLEEMSFEAKTDGHSIMLDADAESGGKERGPRPKTLTLVSLAGCTGMDVVALMRKMKVNFTGFSIAVEGDLAEEHPKTYVRIRIIYTVRGKDLPLDKIQKAVDLSQERYCGVNAMLKKGAEISYEIKLIE